MVLATIGLFFLACVLLVISGAVLIKSLSKLAVFLRMNEFMVAFVIMAVCTSLPELFVGINSALAGNPAFTLGNVIGANIIALSLLAGISVVLARGIRIDSPTLRKDVFWMVALAALPMALMMIGGVLSRFDALILLGAYVIYFYKMFLSGHIPGNKQAEHIPHWKGTMISLFFIASAAALYFSAKMAVYYGTALATTLAMPPIMVGLFFVSFGTSLPDLVFCTRAVLTKHAPLALGDIVGSVVVNSTIVLAVTALICPITDSFVLFVTSASFMIAITFLFATFIAGGKKLSWREGVSLILFYVLFVIVEMNLEHYFA